jgi:hypothetical protein
MRIRFALLASCLAIPFTGDGVAQTRRPAPPPTVHPIPAPVPVPPAPRRPPQPMPPEVAAALRDARASEALLTAGRLDDAIANYRRAVAEPTTGETAGVVSVRTIHLSMLASMLILRDRADDADILLAELIAAPPPGLRENHLYQLLRLVDLRIYIASGRADAEALVALLEQRARLRPSTSPLACADPPLMPHAIAPMHHDARVREALRQFGCSDEIVEQIDRIAREPIMIGVPLPAPGLRPVPATRTSE